MEHRPLSVMRFFERGLTSMAFWWCVCLLWAAILAWVGRDAMNPDGLSYLDMATGSINQGPAQLINGYWSPGYPALIALAALLFQPYPRQEFPLVHAANFVAFALALWAFSFLIRSWIEADAVSEVNENERARYVIPFAFGIFLWFMTEFIGLYVVTPDLLVSAIVFAAAGIVFRLSRSGSGNFRPYVALGLTLGLGYYVKAVLFMSGMALLAALLLFRPRNLCRKGLLVSALVFLAVSAPLVTLISVHVGRVSGGETGKLSYLWFVNHRELLPTGAWTGDFGKLYPVLTHPPRILAEKPLTIEFATPLPGTFPLWYEASYWWSGAGVRFDWHQQWRTIQGTMRAYDEMGLEMSPLILGSLLLCILTAFRRVSGAPSRGWLWQIAWPLSLGAIYGVVLVVDRYLAPFLVLFWLAIYSHLMFRVSVLARATILVGVLAMLLVPPAVKLAAVANAAVQNRGREPEYRTIARGLTEQGIHGGDRLAVVGYAFDAYYARFARLHITGNVEDAGEFWRLDAADLKTLEDRLAASGVKALVARNRPAGSWPQHWRDLSGTESARFSVLLLDEALANVH